MEIRTARCSYVTGFAAEPGTVLSQCGKPLYFLCVTSDQTVGLGQSRPTNFVSVHNRLGQDCPVPVGAVVAAILHVLQTWDGTVPGQSCRSAV